MYCTRELEVTYYEVCINCHFTNLGGWRTSKSTPKRTISKYNQSTYECRPIFKYDIGRPITTIDIIKCAFCESLGHFFPIQHKIHCMDILK